MSEGEQTVHAVVRDLHDRGACLKLEPLKCDAKDCGAGWFLRQAVEAGIKLGEQNGAREERDRLLAMASPWPLPEVLRRLAAAARHLLGHHSCDAHGHEGVKAAADAATAWLEARGFPT